MPSKILIGHLKAS